MPPANSPNREPTPFTSALRGLESPVSQDVLNLAATLTTQLSDDDRAAAGDRAGDMDEAHASLRYLRREQARDEQRLEESRARLRQLERTRDDLDHRDRLRRSIDRLNRLHEASAQAQYAQQHRSTAAVPYSEQIPSQNSLNDWAPHPQAFANSWDFEEAPYHLSEAELERRSLRRFSARTHNYLRRFRMGEAAREGQQPARDSATRERYQASRSSQPAAQPPTVAPMLEHTVKYLSRIRHASTVDESLNCAHDAGFLSKDYFCIQYADFLSDTRSIPPPQETSWLAPGAVLSGCQHATTSTATPNLASSQLPPPPRPWLSSSYSTPRSLTSYPTPGAPSRIDPSQPPPHQDRWPVKVTVHAVDWSEMSLSATMEAYNVPSHPHQNSLNHTNGNQSPYTRTSSITTYLEGEILDFNTHTLLTESFKSSAANDALYWRKLPPFRDMSDEDAVRALTSRRWWETLNREWVLMRWKERCFVKSMRPGSGSKDSSLEPSPAPTAPSRPHIDALIATDLTGEEYYTYEPPLAAAATDEGPRWVDAEHAAFDDSGCGLTISGFYYVCLRRDDGGVEGLYYDPMSSPYQCLRLESRPRKAFAKWEFA